MPLSPGSQLGIYEIIGALGAGGMGEVYRARDTQLNRDVAIKVLPQLFAQDTERVARFTREAHTLAALNHPHIAQVYGLVSAADGGPALVMELVDGDDLSVVIARGPIPVAEALPIGRQVADALQAAHEQGIVHRDLKPANVKLRPDGTIKVLDFGLAKAMDPRTASGSAAADLAHSPTFTSPMTEMGMILGTAAYMSPEQARGKVVDKRADIWAFGCLLYEMLTGRRAFAGGDVTETITAVMRDEPDWTLLPSGLSPSIERFIRRSVAKNPRERVQDAGDLRLALEGAFDIDAARTAGTPAPERRRTGLMAAAALALAATAAAAGWYLRPAPATPDVPVRRFAVSPAPAVLAIANTNRDFALSPDGNFFVYLASEGNARNLYIRRLSDLEPKLLRRADRYFEPFVSHDGRWIAFNDESDYTLRKIDVNGGPPVEIARVGSELLGATWGDDGTIVYAVDAGLFRVPASGGTPVAVLKPDSSKDEFVFAWPVFLPGSKTVLYAARSGRASEWTINAMEVATGAAKVLVRGGTSPLYSRSGHLLYVSEQALQGVAFDPVRVEVTGDRRTLLDGILAKTSGSANVAVAADGTLVYIAGRGPSAKREVVWIDREGKTESLGMPQRGYTSARLSPDGTRIALDILDDQGGVWLWDIARRGLTILSTQEDRVTGVPAWTSDGKSVIFSTAREGPLNLFVKSADGTGAVRRITNSQANENISSITADGKQVVFTRVANSGTFSDLLIAPIDGTLPAGTPLLGGKSSELNGEISPDGRWIAYESDESGLSQIYVRPFPNIDSGRWQISYEIGFQPMWSPASDELFFMNNDNRLHSARIAPGASFVAGPAKPIGNLTFFAAVVPRTFDISRDGKRFLVIRGIEEANWQAVVTVVQNWAQELKR